MGFQDFLVEAIRSKERLRGLVNMRGPHKGAQDEILDMFVASGAVLQGHFQLESGQHSSVFLRFASVAGSTQSVERIAKRLLEELKNDGVDFDAVLVQEAAGRSLAETIATRCGKRIIVVETDEHNRPMGKLVNETTLYRGDRVLVVSDLSTSGSGLRTMTSVVRQKRGLPVAVLLFASRNRDEISKFEQEEHIKTYALADLDFEQMTYGKPGAQADEKQCEECRKGTPLVSSWEI